MTSILVKVAIAAMGVIAFKVMVAPMILDMVAALETVTKAL